MANPWPDFKRLMGRLAPYGPRGASAYLVHASPTSAPLYFDILRRAIGRIVRRWNPRVVGPLHWVHAAMIPCEPDVSAPVGIKRRKYTPPD